MIKVICSINLPNLNKPIQHEENIAVHDLFSKTVMESFAHSIKDHIHQNFNHVEFIVQRTEAKLFIGNLSYISYFISIEHQNGMMSEDVDLLVEYCFEYLKQLLKK